MSTKKRMERDIKMMSRQCFRKINTYREYILIALLFFFTYLVSIQPTNEKIAVYIISLVAIHIVIRKVRDQKLKSEHHKK